MFPRIEPGSSGARQDCKERLIGGRVPGVDFGPGKSLTALLNQASPIWPRTKCRPRTPGALQKERSEEGRRHPKCRTKRRRKAALDKARKYKEQKKNSKD